MTGSILKNGPCALGKNGYSDVVRLSVPNRSVQSSVLFKSCSLISLLSGYSIHCWKWGTEIYYECVTFSSVKVCSIYLSALLLDVHIYNYYMFLVNWSFSHYIVSILAFVSFWLKVYYAWYNYGHSYFLLATICKIYLFPFFHFQCMGVLISKASVLYTIYSWILVFNPLSHSIPFDMRV